MDRVANKPAVASCTSHRLRQTPPIRLQPLSGIEGSLLGRFDPFGARPGNDGVDGARTASGSMKSGARVVVVRATV
jgi:hypothetical protein